MSFYKFNYFFRKIISAIIFAILSQQACTDSDFHYTFPIHWSR